VFVLWELRAEAPAVNLRVLKNASFASGTIVIGVLGMALWGGMILMPLFFQQLLGYSATQAGVTLIPRSLSMLLMMPIAGMLYNRLGVFVMLPCGLLLSGGAGLLTSCKSSCRRSCRASGFR
jgi:DHA2 family multidrug resistance protein